MFALYRTLTLGLVTCVLTGCQSAQRRYASKDAPDVFHYTGNPPVLMFIPLASLGPEDSRGYPAEIALPTDRGFTTNRIEVAVGGAVASPGIVRLRSGSTDLEAVSAAGGFEPWAHKKRLRVSKHSGQPVTIYFHSRTAAGARYRLVWYDTTENDSGKAPVSDYVLDAGDEFHVPKAVY